MSSAEASGVFSVALFVRTLRWYYSFVRLRQQRACEAYGLWPSSTDPPP